MTDAQESKPAPLPPGKRGQGRKPLPEEERGKSHGVRLTPKRIDRFKILGGNQWLSGAIDKAWEKLQAQNAKQKKENPPS